MAAASHALRASLLACRQSIRPAVVRRSQPLLRRAERGFTSTTPRWVDKGEDNDALEDEGPLRLAKMEASLLSKMDKDTMAHMDELAKLENSTDIDEYFKSELNTPEGRRDDRFTEDKLQKIDFGDRPDKGSLWFDEDDPYTNTDEPAFDEDDMTEMAHGKLDEVKEMRHYARLAVWEMPLLSKLAKPFKPPTEKEVLRWRYTDYLGDNHPSDRKVVVQFAPDDLKLTPQQSRKLTKLAGPRYNPSTQLIKMSSDSYQNAAQNKAYLSNLVDDLIAAAKDPKDTFEDVPLDTRHHQVEKKPKFPKEWLLTKDRKKALENAWEKAMLEDGKRAEAGTLVDGERKIEKFLLDRSIEQQKKQLEQQKVAEMVPAASSGGARARRR
ncbi:mitochondrial ribosomal subunit protein [Sarocladium implicatum]|nr:mitochondrial ribosomal subunit protein [Sarocladium implicatum]